MLPPKLVTALSKPLTLLTLLIVHYSIPVEVFEELHNSDLDPSTLLLGNVSGGTTVKSSVEYFYDYWPS